MKVPRKITAEIERNARLIVKGDQASRPPGVRGQLPGGTGSRFAA